MAVKEWGLPLVWTRRWPAMLIPALFGPIACKEDTGYFPPPSSSGGRASGGAGVGGSSGMRPAGGSSVGGSDVGGHDGGADAGAAGSAGDAGSARMPCATDGDCDDKLFCNGVERCIAQVPGTDAKFCRAEPSSPCADRECNETQAACDCSEPDRDGDGALIPFCAQKLQAPEDCDDADPERRPGLMEVCDPDDPSLDPRHDEDCRDQTYGTRDVDGDGYYDERCGNALAYGGLAAGTDCNDLSSAIHPQAEELCDGVDNNCNGIIDEVFGIPNGELSYYYRDTDNDSWGDPADRLETQCKHAPPGYSTLPGDCNDDNPGISPAREETCNGLDDDCDGTADQPRQTGALLFDEPYDGVTRFECDGTAGWTIAACPPGRLNCGDQSYRDACETIGTTLCNCHACGNACTFACGETSCEEVAAVSAGLHHACALILPAADAGALDAGSVACWGGNQRGQLGNGSTADVRVPIKVPGLAKVRSVTSGAAHSCAIAGDDSAIFCWGDDAKGQLGSTRTGPNLTASFSPYPLAVEMTNGPFARAAAGWEHTCAVHADGRLVCWGNVSGGRLGNGDTQDRVVELPVAARRQRAGVESFIGDAKDVVVGDEHTCMLTLTGTVECWGDNSLGQLGDGFGVPNAAAAQVVAGLESVDEIAAGSYYTCARRQADVYCWGSNFDGELAFEGDSDGLPVRIPNLVGVRSVATGRTSACVLTEAGTVSCWGTNLSGERGFTGTAPPPVIPTTTSLVDVQAVFSGGGYFRCARTVYDGTVCWGDNLVGQLGDGTASSQPEPVARAISPLDGARTCALK